MRQLFRRRRIRNIVIGKRASARAIIYKGEGHTIEVAAPPARAAKEIVKVKF
jgi:hypothetical protein